MTFPHLPSEITEWAQWAGFSFTHDSDALVLYSEGGEFRHYLRQEAGWWQVSFAARRDDEHCTFRASSEDVLAHYLVEVFGIAIRGEQGRSFLRLPHQREDLATGYTLSEMSDAGFRTLARDGEGPIATARDRALSMLILVPLSHYLQLTIAQLKAAFLSEDGSPLLSGDSYRTP